MSTKKPVVVESYDEIVFPEPSEAFLARVQNQRALIVPRLPAGSVLPPPGMNSFCCAVCNFSLSCHACNNYSFSLHLVPVEDPSKRKRGDTKDHPMSQWFMNFSEADELLQLAAARQQVSITLSEISGYRFALWARRAVTVCVFLAKPLPAGTECLGLLFLHIKFFCWGTSWESSPFLPFVHSKKNLGYKLKAFFSLLEVIHPSHLYMYDQMLSLFCSSVFSAILLASQPWIQGYNVWIQECVL